MVSVLVVDDEPSILRLVSAILADAQCEVQTAPDAESALRLLHEHKPDLVIADIVLPGMDGRDLARRIKTDPELSPIPVILMSAYAHPTAQVGADDFISKPFDIDEFVTIVKSHLNR